MANRTLTVVGCVALVVAVANGLVGCGEDGDRGANGDGDKACPAEVLLDGRKYAETPASGRLVTQEQIGKARFTACSDGHSDPDADARMQAWALAGVDRVDGIAVELGGDLYLYIASDHPDPCAVRYTRCK